MKNKNEKNISDIREMMNSLSFALNYLIKRDDDSINMPQLVKQLNGWLSKIKLRNPSYDDLLNKSKKDGVLAEIDSLIALGCPLTNDDFCLKKYDAPNMDCSVKDWGNCWIEFYNQK